MNNFSYAKATSVKEAIEQQSNNKTAKYIAGGTNLVDLLKYNIEQPAKVVDISKLALADIKETEEGGLRLGALVTNADTAYHKTVEAQYPMLSKTILAGASAQLRNMATNGGNLLQRTRCYYFYDTATPCNKREPGSGCSAIKGFNRIHAILGTSEQCIATHPSDMCVALAALDATIQVTGAAGDRSIPILDFHRLPGNEPEKDSNLMPDEVITSIDLPKKGFSQHSTYVKVRDRSSYAFAVVSVAAALELDGDKIKDIRIALGGVAHKPWRDPAIEKSMIGAKANTETFEKLANQLLKGAKGFGHNDFKIDLAKTVIVRALNESL